jgi:pyruvate formate lyase activating enzyme
MKFGGLQKISLLDYPGKICAIFFSCGCNFACPYCHNPQLVRDWEKSMTVFGAEKVYAFLKDRCGFIDGVVISGGEPTLQGDLAEVCRHIKAMGFAVKVDTNGSRPEVIRRLIDNQLVDYVAMDIKTLPVDYDPVIQRHCRPEDIEASIRVIMDTAPAYEFKTTCVSPLVTEHTVEEISRLIQGARLYVLQQFHHTGVLKPGYFEKYPRQYDMQDLLKLKTFAAPWVRECKVR